VVSLRWKSAVVTLDIKGYVGKLMLDVVRVITKFWIVLEENRAIAGADLRVWIGTPKVN